MLEMDGLATPQTFMFMDAHNATTVALHKKAEMVSLSGRMGPGQYKAGFYVALPALKASLPE